MQIPLLLRQILKKVKKYKLRYSVSQKLSALGLRSIGLVFHNLASEINPSTLYRFFRDNTLDSEIMISIDYNIWPSLLLP